MKTNLAFKHVAAGLAFAVVFFGWVMNAQASTSPSSLIIKIYEMRVSMNPNCSDSHPVFATDSPTAVDMFGNHDLGSGTISTGTYHCVMFHISDNVTFTPIDGSQEYCTAGKPYTDDILPAGVNSITPDGVPITGTGSHTPLTLSDDRPWIYLSDAPTAVTLNNTCFMSTKPCVMAPLVIVSDQPRALVMNATLQLGYYDTDPPTCVLNPIDPALISIR